MFRLLPKKKKSRFHSFSALFVQRKFAEFSANEIRGEKKSGRRGEGEGEGGEFDQGDSVGGGASHRATCECEHKSKLAAT